MIEFTALVPFLKSDPGVTAICADRISPGKSRQTLPCPRLTYQRIGTPFRVISNSGPGRLAKARIQFSAWGQGPTAYEDAKRLIEALRLAVGTSSTSEPAAANYATLHGYKGVMNGVTIQKAVLGEDRDDFTPPVDGDDGGWQRVSADLEIWWLEPAAS